LYLSIPERLRELKAHKLAALICIGDEGGAVSARGFLGIALPPVKDRSPSLIYFFPRPTASD